MEIEADIGNIGTSHEFVAGLGLRVVAIDNRLEGLDLAREAPKHLKPAKTIDYNDPEATKKIVASVGGGGLTGVVICTDSVEATEWSLKLLRPHGVCVPLGLPERGSRFPAFDIMFKKLEVKGSLVANQRLVSDMMNFVAKIGVWSHVQTIQLEEGTNLPDR
ncbi:alcohol dehydrogenase [Penicillium canescens]|nr:alcohol dehydrogenase [Penicillium canescens]